MEKIICASCGATMTPNNTQPFLTCEYCDTTVPNAYYSESAAAAAIPAQVTLNESCVKTLLEMGRDEKLASVDENCFGEPLLIADVIRAELEIPQEEQAYLLYDRFSLLGSFKEGFALTDTGMYYKYDGETGRRSWEAFITAPISGVGQSGLFQDGALQVGTGLTFGVANDDDSRIARFVVDLHNRLYLRQTGSNAPASWRFRSAEVSRTIPGASVSRPSTAQTLIGAAASLLLGSSLTGARHPQLHTRPANPLVIGRKPVAPQKPAPRPATVRPTGAKPLRKPHHQTAAPAAHRPLGQATMNRPEPNRPAANRPIGRTMDRPAANRPAGRTMDRPSPNRSAGPNRPGGRGRR